MNLSGDIEKFIFLVILFKIFISGAEVFDGTEQYKCASWSNYNWDSYIAGICRS